MRCSDFSSSSPGNDIAPRRFLPNRNHGLLFAQSTNAILMLSRFHIHQIVVTFLMNGGRDGQEGSSAKPAVHHLVQTRGRSVGWIDRRQYASQALQRAASTVMRWGRRARTGTLQHAPAETSPIKRPVSELEAEISYLQRELADAKLDIGIVHIVTIVLFINIFHFESTR
jgi:hypothetical protein